MGWTFYAPRRRDLVADLIRGSIDHHDTGRVLWTVHPIDGAAAGRPEIDRRPMIVCHLVEQDGRSWGHKSMGEDVGPYHYSVPAEWLDRYPDPQISCSTSWRAEVRHRQGPRIPPVPHYQPRNPATL